MKNYVDGFEKLVTNQNLLSQVTENVGSKTDYPMAPNGLRVYWNTLCDCNGWKLQKNYYFDNCRIIDECHVRRAWGKEGEMITTLESLAV